MTKTVVIVCHSNGHPGGLITLQQHLEHQGYRVVRLLHPLEDYGRLATTLEHDGRTDIYPRRPRGLLNLFGDLWLSIKILRRTPYDICIGASNFDAIAPIVVRFLGKRKPKIIYYPRDYAQDRFSNRILNRIYEFIEHVAVTGADWTISNTQRSEAKRLQHGLAPGRSLVIPNPVNIKHPVFKPKTIRKDHFIYVGDITREHGLYDLLKTIGPLIKKLVIIGTGPDWQLTVDLAKSQGYELEAHYAKPQSFVIDYLQRYDGIGLAPYNLFQKWTYYCSPLKAGEYIGCCLPLLISDVPEVSLQIERDHLGAVYQHLDRHHIEQKLAQLELADFHHRAKAFYESNNMKTLFAKLPL